MKKQYLKDYIIYGRNSQLKLEGFEKIILADDKVRLLDEVFERMDYTTLYRAYSGGRKAAETITKNDVQNHGLRKQ